MASKNKKPLSAEEKRRGRQRRVMQVVLAIFSILLILSMVLSLTSSY
jgi:predicted nucleic acid-binding Zn ribbon protein